VAEHVRQAVVGVRSNSALLSTNHVWPPHSLDLMPMPARRGAAEQQPRGSVGASTPTPSRPPPGVRNGGRSGVGVDGSTGFPEVAAGVKCVCVRARVGA